MEMNEDDKVSDIQQTHTDGRYYALLEELVHAMTEQDRFDLQRIMRILAELCVLLRVSRGVTVFYETPADEARGEGEVFVCYDSGEESRPVSVKRTVSPTQMVVTCTVYQAVDAAPLTAEERGRVELIQSMLLTFISRHRLQRVVEKLTFADNEGYANMRAFLTELVRQGQQGLLAGKTALRFNLRHFSLVNQQLGRQGASAVMREYYHRLRGVLGEGGFIARMGGDNFVAICDQGCEAAVLAFMRGKSIEYVPEGEVPDAGTQVTVSAIAGVFRIPERFEFHDPGDVMDKINSTYQIAKHGGLGEVTFYTDEITLEKEKVMRVQQRFAKGLKREEFLVYYQPKVDINSRELIGAEALCRWMRRGQMIPPLEFIPVLEQGMEICKLDFYMLDHVCRDIRRWLDAGLDVVRVSVNLSRRHMSDPDLFDHIVDIVDRNGVPHEYIEIELTETTTDVEFKDLKRVVNGLQKVGISTSVDDFGVGYSSLNLIKEIPWNVLKLDKSMLPANEKTARGRLMFKHIVAMAHEIGTQCVAEGVETSEQMKILQENGCRIAQGFYFDRPLPCGEFEERLKKHHY